MTSSTLVFPFTHIGGIGWLFSSMMVGFKTIVIESFDPGDDDSGAATRKASRSPARARRSIWRTWRRSARTRRTKLFPTGACVPGRRSGRSRVQLHYDVKKELGGVGVVSGYGLTECPILAMATVDDPDVKLAETEGRTTPGVEVKVVKLDESVAKPGEEGEIRVKGPMLFPATSTRRSIRTPSTRTAGSAPATSASRTPTATSRSRAGSRT